MKSKLKPGEAFGIGELWVPLVLFCALFDLGIWLLFMVSLLSLTWSM